MQELIKNEIAKINMSLYTECHKQRDTDFNASTVTLKLNTLYTQVKLIWKIVSVYFPQKIHSIERLTTFNIPAVCYLLYDCRKQPKYCIQFDNIGTRLKKLFTQMYIYIIIAHKFPRNAISQNLNNLHMKEHAFIQRALIEPRDSTYFQSMKRRGHHCRAKEWHM